MKIKVFIFFTFLALAIASLQLSVFADETQKEHVQNMTLVNKPEKLFTAQGVYKKTNLKDKLLILKIKDTQPQSGVCNYYVTHTELDQKNSTLKVIVAKDFCPNERFGKSEGEIYWVVPKSLALQSAKICLSVNNQKLGLINLGENKNKFDVRDACQ